MIINSNKKLELNRLFNISIAKCIELLKIRGREMINFCNAHWIKDWLDGNISSC